MLISLTYENRNGTIKSPLRIAKTEEKGRSDWRKNTLAEIWTLMEYPPYLEGGRPRAYWNNGSAIRLTRQEYWDLVRCLLDRTIHILTNRTEKKGDLLMQIPTESEDTGDNNKEADRLSGRAEGHKVKFTRNGTQKEVNTQIPWRIIVDFIQEYFNPRQRYCQQLRPRTLHIPMRGDTPKEDRWKCQEFTRIYKEVAGKRQYLITHALEYTGRKIKSLKTAMDKRKRKRKSQKERRRMVKEQKKQGQEEYERAMEKGKEQTDELGKNIITIINGTDEGCSG
jgi:hypothetical protein